jgi:predicted nuclease of predicted toxin-antitoxin system
LVDEDLSPVLVTECHSAGYDATSTRDRGMLGAADQTVAELCMDEERALVTNNADDFLRLARKSELHPGLVVMPLGSRADERAWMRAALTHIERCAQARQTEPAECMVNRVVEVDENGAVADYEYP